MSPVPDPAQVAALAARLRDNNRRLPGGSLGLLHVPTGGCGGCQLELELLGGLAPLGMQFVDTPRHANVLVATGGFARNAAGALRRAWEAMPDPKFLVAVGDCAAGADALAPGAPYALEPGGLRAALPVDLAIRGAPPTPDAIIYGLATLRAAIAAV